MTSEVDTTSTAIPAHSSRGKPDTRPCVVWVHPEMRLFVPSRQGVTLGRDPACDVPLQGEQLSRRHARVWWDDEGIGVRDLGSKNGTFINGRPLQEAARPSASCVLRMGDWVGCIVDGVPDGVGLDELSPGLWAGPTLRASLHDARKAAASDVPIVIAGETGTGKERVARAIHAWSGREGPYVGVNCAAIAGNLAVGQLFGHARGAFTGAERRVKGFFEQAHGGTLMLDELLELPHEIQPLLLRALEEREVQPLGESRAVRVDVRLVVALQAPLQQAVASGRLRADLAARLGPLSVRVPPLRERREDIAPLFRAFVERHAERLGLAGTPALDAQLVEMLCRHAWPLNVRELERVAETMTVLHGREPSWGPQHVPEGFHPCDAPTVTGADSNRDPAVRDAERRRLVDALRTHRGNVSRAAKAAGISRAHAYKLMDIYGVNGRDFRET